MFFFFCLLALRLSNFFCQEGSGTYYHILLIFLYLSLFFRVKEKHLILFLCFCEVRKRRFCVYIFGLQSLFHFIFHIRRTQTSWLQQRSTCMWFTLNVTPLNHWQLWSLTGQTGTAESNNGCIPLIYCTVCQILPWFSSCTNFYDRVIQLKSSKALLSEWLKGDLFEI